MTAALWFFVGWFGSGFAVAWAFTQSWELGVVVGVIVFVWAARRWYLTMCPGPCKNGSGKLYAPFGGKTFWRPCDTCGGSGKRRRPAAGRATR